MSVISMPSSSIGMSASKSEKIRKARLLRVICLISIGTQLVTMSLSLVLALAADTTPQLPYFTMAFIELGLTLISYRLARQGKYRQGAWFLIVPALFIISVSRLQSGTNLPIMVFYMLPIAIAIVLLELQETLIITTGCILFTLGTFLAQEVFHFYKPLTNANHDILSVFNVFVEVVILPVVIALLIIPARSQTRTLLAQNERLEAALREIENRQRGSEHTSQEVLALATELKVTATQQSAGSHQQVSAVSQINASLNELSATAINIADLSGQVNGAARRMAADSQQIEETTYRSVAQSDKGIATTENTVLISSDVAGLYQELVETMGELDNKNANMRHILDLLASIASETHLLALNASIEAAGAGEFGERFSVVAQEVKNLATRSAAANKEVVQIIREIEQTTRQAVVSAKSGFEKAGEMREAAGQSGKVIAEMRQVSEQSQQQAISISQLSQEVSRLTEVIRVATIQQRSASQQVLEALDGLTTVAHQGASGSSVVSTTAVKLEEMSYSLRLALAA